MEIVKTDAAPAAIGPYSQAIATRGPIFVSGQLGLDPKTGTLVEGIEAQSHQAIANMAAILAAVGLDETDVVKTTCFLTDMADFDVFNAIYAERFVSNPARSCVEVSALPKGGLVEIEAIAMRR